MNKYTLQGFTPSAEPIDVDFGVYNYIKCRPEHIATFPLETNTNTPQNGFIIAMDYYRYSIGPPINTIFSIRDTSNNFKSLTCFYDNGGVGCWVNTTINVNYYPILPTSLPQITSGIGKLS